MVGMPLRAPDFRYTAGTIRGANFTDNFRRAAGYVNEILRLFFVLLDDSIRVGRAGRKELRDQGPLPYSGDQSSHLNRLNRSGLNWM